MFSTVSCNAVRLAFNPIQQLPVLSCQRAIEISFQKVQPHPAGQYPGGVEELRQIFHDPVPRQSIATAGASQIDHIQIAMRIIALLIAGSVAVDPHEEVIEDH